MLLFNFSKFTQKGGFSFFPIKKGGGEGFKKGVSEFYTNFFQCFSVIFSDSLLKSFFYQNRIA